MQICEMPSSAPKERAAERTPLPGPKIFIMRFSNAVFGTFTAGDQTTWQAHQTCYLNWLQNYNGRAFQSYKGERQKVAEKTPSKEQRR